MALILVILDLMYKVWVEETKHIVKGNRHMRVGRGGTQKLNVLPTSDDMT